MMIFDHWIDIMKENCAIVEKFSGIDQVSVMFGAGIGIGIGPHGIGIGIGRAGIGIGIGIDVFENGWYRYRCF